MLRVAKELGTTIDGLLKADESADTFRPAGRIRSGSRVYFLQAGDPTLVKIGKTHDIEARLAAIRLNSGIAEPRLLTWCPGYTAVETALHHRFKAYRVHSEWFRLEGGLASFILAHHPGKPLEVTAPEPSNP